MFTKPSEGWFPIKSTGWDPMRRWWISWRGSVNYLLRSRSWPCGTGPRVGRLQHSGKPLRVHQPMHAIRSDALRARICLPWSVRNQTLGFGLACAHAVFLQLVIENQWCASISRNTRLSQQLLQPGYASDLHSVSSASLSIFSAMNSWSSFPAPL